MDRLIDLLASLWHRFGWYRPRPASDLIGQKPRRLLLVQLQFLGDSLVAFPLLRALRAGFPSTQIDALTSATSQSVFERNPDINECLVLPQWERGGWARWAGLFAELPNLRRRQYDWILCDGSALSFAYGLLAWLTRIPVRLGFDWRHRGILFTHVLPFPGPEDPSSMVSINLRWCKTLGIPPLESTLHFPVRPKEREQVLVWLRQEAGSSRPLVVIHPGSKWPSNQWMSDRFTGLTDWLVETYRAVVIFVGAAHELSPFQELFGRQKTVLNWGGRTDLGELAALFEMADAVITLGSGPSHLAAAVKAPTLVIRSAQQVAGRWEHAQPRYESIRKVVPCSPCDSAHCRNVSRPMWCMELITVEEVQAVLARFLNKYPASSL